MLNNTDNLNIEQIEIIRSLISNGTIIPGNEAATKNWLIIPFIEALGYNTRTPEVTPEYTCDVGTKQGEKVDYAIFSDGVLEILIECKPFKTSLDRITPNQLFRYFTTSDAKVGILTNGDDYWFYTDRYKTNIMDTEPYYKLRLSEATRSELEGLYVYARDSISALNIKEYIKNKEFKAQATGFISDIIHGSVPDSLIKLLSNDANLPQSTIEDRKIIFNEYFSEILKEMQLDQLESSTSDEYRELDYGTTLTINTAESEINVPTSKLEVECSYNPIVVGNREETLYRIWELFIEYCNKTDNADISVRKPSKYNWYDFYTSNTFNLGATINQNAVELYIYVHTTEYFKILEEKKVEIEEDFGDELAWYTSRQESKAKRIIYTKSVNVYGFKDPQEFKRLFDWLIDSYRKLYAALDSQELITGKTQGLRRWVNRDNKSNIQLNHEYTFNDYSDGDWTHHKLGYAVVFGERYAGISGPKLAAVIIEKCLDKGYTTIDNLLNIGDYCIRTEDKMDYRFTKVDNYAVAVNTHHSFNGLMKLIQKILDNANQSYDNVKLSFIS